MYGSFLFQCITLTSLSCASAAVNMQALFGRALLSQILILRSTEHEANTCKRSVQTTLESSVGQDQRTKKAVTDQGLNCLPLKQQGLRHINIRILNRAVPEQTVQTEIRCRLQYLIWLYMVCHSFSCFQSQQQAVK